MDIRKKKRVLRPTLSFAKQHFSLKSLVMCFSFVLFLLLLSRDFGRGGSGSFKPARVIMANLSVFSTSSIIPEIPISPHHHTTINTTITTTIAAATTTKTTTDFSIDGRVLFTDHVLVVLSSSAAALAANEQRPHGDPLREKMECVYQRWDQDGEALTRPILSADEYGDTGDRWVVRCPYPPANHSAGVGLRAPDWELGARENQTVQSWDTVAYEATFDGEDKDIAVVFVKGFNLRSDKESYPDPFTCRFEVENKSGDGVGLTSRALTASQEIIRCPLPQELKTNHAWLGVQRWFLYDNNSDDDLKNVIDELNSGNYNVSRHVWPWVKAQEAGFSHCVLRARDECNWVAFFDVDEFYYFQTRRARTSESNFGYPGPNSLRNLLRNVSSSSPSVGEVRTDCYSYGPSELKKSPPRGVMVGYTCRIRSPERHKSIVRPDAVSESLLNQVHHFRLKKQFKKKNLLPSVAVINHYKYQVWDVFKAKFHRRVSTYVADWQEKQNENSRDRAPGLGTEAVEPPDWHKRFCEVWDTKLRDFVVGNLTDPTTGLLPWERSVQ